jgi:hypothetical protein
MKKQLTILILLFFNCSFSWSQQFVKTTTPCNDELLKKTPGRWIKGGNGFHAKVSQQQQKEIQTRLDAIHPFVFNLYPSPVAFDAQWFGFTDDQEFGSQLKIDPSTNVMNRRMDVNGTPTIYYSYSAKFCAYHCGRETYEILRGQGCEAGTSISVHINKLENLFLHDATGKSTMEVMRVDERPIKMMPVLTGKWKGYDVYAPEPGSGTKMVLLHREGILPYIPVTRKQYLDRCLEYLPKFFTPDPDGLKVFEAWGRTKKDYEEELKKNQKIRDDVLKHYKDELQASTSAGLLDFPAIISSYIADIGTNYPIFTTQAAGGKMLVTENPAYMKKNLPKYIPQFMVYTWWDCRCGVDPSLNPYKLIDENFPIEKLQAMIDK